MANETPAQRVYFSKLSSPAEMPNLLEVQLHSYGEFLQASIRPSKRKNQGLEKIFQEIFPVTDVHENFTLEYVKYSVGTPRYTIKECKERNMTFAAPLKATLRLVAKEQEENSNEVKDIIEQDVFLGELPLITPSATFIINGAERVVVNQLHRSPGVSFDDEIHPNGKRLFHARIIPFRGSWVEFNIDINDIMFVHIDSRRKLPVTTFLRALGYSENEQLINEFFEVTDFKLTARTRDKILNKVAAETLADEETGEVVIDAGEDFTEEIIDKLIELKIKQFKIIDAEMGQEEKVIFNTIKKDPTTNQEEALFKLYSLIRPGDAPTLELAQSLIESMFFSEKRYDLGEVGRYMVNQRLNLDVPLDHTVLDRKDFIAIITYLIKLRNGVGYIDDIDHLGNRRARTVGELLANLFSVGLSRVARTIRERMSLKDTEKHYSA